MEKVGAVQIPGKARIFLFEKNLVVLKIQSVLFSLFCFYSRQVYSFLFRLDAFTIIGRHEKSIEIRVLGRSP